MSGVRMGGDFDVGKFTASDNCRPYRIIEVFVDSVKRSVGRHFVSLSCVTHGRAQEPVHVIFSGFVFSIWGWWFLITAGSVLRQARVLVESRPESLQWFLGNQKAAGPDFDHAAVSYSFDPDAWTVVQNDHLCVDYAAVHLGGLYRQQLETSGVRAIDHTVLSTGFAPTDKWAIAGVQATSLTLRESDIGSFVMAWLTERSDDLTSTVRGNQRFASPRDPTQSVSESVESLVGSPILMLHELDDGWQYTILGVRTHWNPNSGTLAICPFNIFASILQQALTPVLLELREGSTEERHNEQQERYRAFRDTFATAMFSWQWVEHAMFIAFWIVSGVPSAKVAIAILYSIQGVVARLRTTDEVASALLPADHLADWKKISNRLRELAKKRNAIAHGTERGDWDDRAGLGTYFLMAHEAQWRRNDARLTTEWISEVARQFLSLENELWHFAGQLANAEFHRGLSLEEVEEILSLPLGDRRGWLYRSRTPSATLAVPSITRYMPVPRAEHLMPVTDFRLAER